MTKIDLAKRRRIMQRSQMLGHCVCDPRRPCPCDVFTGQGICPCAGERPAPPDDLSAVRLTEHVHNAGCASKIAPADLEQVLSRLPKVADPAVLSGIPAGDDAGVYALADGVTLVQTVDVFTPCVDDAETFGRICAANCLSDIYAMGAQPRTALSILCFPSETLDGRLMYQMMKGAMDTLAEAGVALLGGHSVKDEEIKLGFAVTGTLPAGAAMENSTARPGDRLVLTKPLGTGVLCFARQVGRVHEAGLAAAEKTMASLNKGAAEAMREAGASACTDVTGFGLFGHLILMARHSGVSVQVFADALPALPGAMELLAEGVIPGAVERNGEFVGPDLVVDEGVNPAHVHLGLDAQTSGGLLIAVPADRHRSLLAALQSRGLSGWTVGRIVASSEGKIHMVASEVEESEVVMSASNEPASSADQAQSTRAEPCCAGGSAATEPSLSADDALKAFGGLMRATAAGGAIDARTKELINFALVVHARCGPCIEVHLAKARKMGISQAELDEAAWCGVAMGGAPVKMFYEQALKQHG